jgi:hypothetical protein
MRLAKLLLRDHAAAGQAVRDVLASRPPQVRDAKAERQAVVSRCRAILRERAVWLPPSGRLKR